MKNSQRSSAVNFSYFAIEGVSIKKYLEIFSPENHFHVFGVAPATHPPGHVPVAGGGDEVVALAWLELHLLGGGGK